MKNGIDIMEKSIRFYVTEKYLNALTKKPDIVFLCNPNNPTGFIMDKEIMEKEFDNILSRAKKENEYILSTYWKEKCNTLLNRCIKYKKNMLFYILTITILWKEP